MISVVIPAYNEEELLPKCLNSLVLQDTNKPFEVIVVDNNSTDNTIKVANSFKNNLDIKVIFETRQTRGAARAAGFAAAKGEIILSTDADVILPSDWINHMIKPFDNPQIVAVRGLFHIRDCSPRINTTVNYLFPLNPIGFRVIFGYWTIAGFNSAIQKDAYIKAGGFDQTLDSQEDVELSVRLHKMGKIVMTRVSVLASGRRFKNGFIRGMLPYYKTSFENFMLKKYRAHLSNIR